MSQKTYDRQTAKFLATVAECMPNMPDDAMQRWIENPRSLKRFLGGLCPSKYLFLTPGEVFTIAGGPLGESFEKGFNPHEFFKIRKGFCVSNEFIDRILSVAERVMEGQPSELKSWDIRKDATDTQIRSELPEDHLVELWQIAKLIEAQPNGEKGLLLTNGHANLFYVKGKGGQVFVVLVYWLAGHGEWGVDAWLLDEGVRWDAGRRVFSRN